MTLTEEVIKRIITRLIKGEDYRIEVVALINAEFLQFAMEFFERIVQAKLRNKDFVDWYKKEFLNTSLNSSEIAINSGLNIKTINNMFNSAKKEVVIDASNEHYEVLYNSISKLVESKNEIDLNLTIKFRGVSVELNINESLIVINTLAVKRAALRGGLWSTVGKKVEKPLMLTLCMLFEVSKDNYSLYLKRKNVEQDDDLGFEREIDFFLKNNQESYKCEVKLMGKGNPEGADTVVARDSKVFVADKLSDLNKKQLDALKVNWVELRSEDGYKKFGKVLQNLNIPHTPFSDDLSKRLAEIFALIF